MVDWAGTDFVGECVTSEAADTRAEEDGRAMRAVRTQRFLLLGGGGVFAALSLGLFPLDGGGVRAGALALVAATVLGLGLLRPTRARLPLVLLPLAVALIFTGAIVANTLSDAAPDVLRFALMCGALAPFLSVLAPTRRGAVASLAAMTATGAGGALLIQVHAASFDAVQAVGLLAAFATLSLAIAHALDNARRESVVLRGELARRATSDEISGVSNRAHVNLLAQNEFSRARRYGEPYSCLMIEIENYDRLLATHGRAAVTAIIQVFTGYCVVVMRHCDSFGRLTPSRFLALLPETAAPGARTLSTRMCRDLAALGVAFGGGQIHFTVSIGCAEMHAVDRWAGDMLRRVEQGLSDALERGGNCAVFATVPVHQPAGETDTEVSSAGDTVP